MRKWILALATLAAVAGSASIAQAQDPIRHGARRGAAAGNSVGGAVGGLVGGVTGAAVGTAGAVVGAATSPFRPHRRGYYHHRRYRHYR